MNSYADIKITDEGLCHKLSCVINNTQLTPLKWLAFIDELTKHIQSIGKDPNIKKFYMYYDVTYVDILMKQDNYKDLVNIFHSNYDLFSNKLLGTFVHIESHILNALVHIFMRFYTPVRPLFVLKTSVIDQQIVRDLLDNRKNQNEYKVN